MKIMYSVFYGRIDEVEVERETEHFVVLANGRKQKKDGWMRYFDTFNDAKEFVVSMKTNSVANCERELAEAKVDLAKALELSDIKKGL